jgi:hypothetical protein
MLAVLAIKQLTFRNVLRTGTEAAVGGALVYALGTEAIDQVNRKFLRR